MNSIILQLPQSTTSSILPSNSPRDHTLVTYIILPAQEALHPTSSSVNTSSLTQGKSFELRLRIRNPITCRRGIAVRSSTFPPFPIIGGTPGRLNFDCCYDKSANNCPYGNARGPASVMDRCSHGPYADMPRMEDDRRTPVTVCKMGLGGRRFFFSWGAG